MCMRSRFRYDQAMILPSVIVQPMARDKSANKSLSYSLISSKIEESAGPMDGVANSAL